MVRILTYYLYAILAFMLYVVVSTSMESNLFHVLPDLLSIPWMKATLWDFYANVFLIYCWVIYKERKIIPVVGWGILFFCLGSIATIFYVLLQIHRLKKGEDISHVLIHKNKSHTHA